MNYDELLGLVKARRSIRRFKPDPIPQEYIDKIIEMARWAPSGFNQQPWEFVVIKKPELKNKIIEYCREQLLLSHKIDPSGKTSNSQPQTNTEQGDYRIAPVFILLLGDHRTIEDLPIATQYGPDYLNNTFNAGLTCAFLYMQLAASTLGLASQWLSAVQAPYEHFMIKELLGIPKYLIVYNLMVLGFPASAPRSKIMREKDEMVHYDYCGPEAFRTDEEVLEFIRKTRS